MFNMFFFVLRIYQDIIQIDYDELVEVIHEYVVHQTRECGWSIGQAKRQDGVLVRTIMSDECGLWNILFTNKDLVVTQPQVEFRECR